MGTRLALADPNGNAGPIAFDDQFNGLYVEAADRATRAAIVDTLLATQEVEIAGDGAAFAVGDQVRLCRDATGTDLTYLEDPASVLTYGVVSKALTRSDLNGVANLLPNPTMTQWTGAANVPPDGWAAVGSPTLTRTTTTGLFQTGGKSCRVQTTVDGDGLATPLARIQPTDLTPDVSGFLSFRVASGQIRVELVATDGTVSWLFPDGVTQVASTDLVGQFTMVGVQGIDVRSVRATQARLRIVQHGPTAADVYVDAGQLTESATQDVFTDGIGANLLHQAANQELLDLAPLPAQWTARVADVFRLDGTEWPQSEVVLGAQHRLSDPPLGAADSVRLVSLRRWLLEEGRTEVTLSTEPDDLASILARRATVTRTTGATPQLTVPSGAQLLTAAAMTAGSAVLTHATAVFRATDVGKTAWVFGAGVGGALLRSVIAGYTNSTTVTLAVAASTTVAAVTALVGSPEDVLTLAVRAGGRNATTILDQNGGLSAQAKDAQSRDLTRLFAKPIAADPDTFDSVTDGATYRKQLPVLVITATQVSSDATTLTCHVAASDPTDAGAPLVTHDGGAAVTNLGGGDYRIARPTGAGPLLVVFTASKTGCVSQSAGMVVPAQDATGTSIVTPNLAAAPGTMTATTQVWTVTASDPGGGATPTIMVTFTGNGGSGSSVGAIAANTPTTVPSGEVITAYRAGAFSTPGQLEIKATSASGAIARIVLTVLNQDKTSYGASLVVTPTPGASSYAIAYSADVIPERSVDGGAWTATTYYSHTDTVTRDGSDHIYAYRVYADDIYWPPVTVVIPALGTEDTVTPDLSVVPGTMTGTTQPFTVTGSNPSGGAAPALSVTLKGTTGSGSSYGAIADGTPATLVSGEVVTVNRPAVDSAPAFASFKAVLAGGGTVEVPIAIQNQNRTSFGPSLDVNATWDADNYSISYSSTGTITLSIDGGSYSAPASSPISVARNAVGGSVKRYTFKAVLDGQTLTKSVDVLPKLSGVETAIPSISGFYNSARSKSGNTLTLAWTPYNEPGGVTYDLVVNVQVWDSTYSTLANQQKYTLTGIGSSPYDLNVQGSCDVDLMDKGDSGWGYVEFDLLLKMLDGSAVKATATCHVEEYGDYNP